MPADVFQQTSICLGLSAELPEVRFVDFTPLGLGPVWGVYHVAGEIVFVNIGDMGLGFERTCETDIAVLRHEFVHHILHKNDMAEDSRTHTESIFEKCGPFIDTHN